MHTAPFAYLDSLTKRGNNPEPAEEMTDRQALALVADKFKAELAAKKEEIYQSNENGLGFATSQSSGTYEPQSLNARHREIIRLHILGYKHVQIAAMLSITPVTVGYVLNSPLGKALTEDISEVRDGSVKDVRKRLQEFSPFAAEVMLDIMADGKSETNRLRAAEKVLELTGQSTVNKNLHVHTQLSQEEILLLKESARGGPEVVEAEGEEIFLDAETSDEEEPTQE